jgi:uncharacterized membrane protein (DUF4010 family)
MTQGSLDQADLFYRFGVALLIGVVVGLQRQHAHGGREKELFAGVRTFALLGLLGAAAALLADRLGAPLLVAAALALVGLLLAATYLAGARDGEVGLTTEVAALLIVVDGALCYWGYLAMAAALGVATTGLLALKVELHSFAHRLSEADIRAALKFAAIAVLVLPLLPDRAIAPPPFDVLNPHRVWLMVVFISAISFLAYWLLQVVGPRRGIGLTGLLGGLVSSTAVTLGLTQRSRSEPALAGPCALAITVAWTMMFVRVAVVVGAVNVELLATIGWPLAAAAVAGAAYAAYLFMRRGAEPAGEVSLTNPFELGPAITFGLLYAAVLLVANLARLSLGDAGVHLSAMAAGVADVDAIALSLAELSRDPSALDPVTAGRAVLLAVLVNTLVKGGVAVGGGARELRRAILPALALMTLAAGGALLVVTR